MVIIILVDLKMDYFKDMVYYFIHLKKNGHMVYIKMDN